MAVSIIVLFYGTSEQLIISKMFKCDLLSSITNVLLSWIKVRMVNLTVDLNGKSSPVLASYGLPCRIALPRGEPPIATVTPRREAVVLFFTPGTTRRSFCSVRVLLCITALSIHGCLVKLDQNITVFGIISLEVEKVCGRNVQWP